MKGRDLEEVVGAKRARVGPWGRRHLTKELSTLTRYSVLLSNPASHKKDFGDRAQYVGASSRSPSHSH